MVIGCVRVTDVSVTDTICSYKNREDVWGWPSGAVYSPGERLK